MTQTSVAFYNGPLQLAFRSAKASVTVDADFSSSVKVGLIDRFRRSYAAWLSETAHSSSLADKLANPRFAEIVALGEDVLPLIFKELKQQPSFLFLAAQQITGENPVTPDAIGDVPKIVACWLKWSEKD